MDKYDPKVWDDPVSEEDTSVKEAKKEAKRKRRQMKKDKEEVRKVDYGKNMVVIVTYFKFLMHTPQVDI